MPGPIRNQPASPLIPKGSPPARDAEIRPAAKAAPKSDPPPVEGFREHLQAAIQLNRSRREIYDRYSGGRTRAFSNTLIGLELLSLPPAMLLDAWAKRFQERGIPIIQGDFVSMTAVRSPFAPPRWRGVANDAEAEQVQAWLAAYRKELGAALDGDDFEGLARSTHDLLGRLERTEREHRTHWAMTKHLIESLGMAAMNAGDYADASNGETRRLSRAFIRLQSMGLLGSVALDRKAQDLHRQGIGILVNDIPDIPFARAWEARSATMDSVRPTDGKQGFRRYGEGAGGET